LNVVCFEKFEMTAAVVVSWRVVPLVCSGCVETAGVAFETEPVLFEVVVCFEDLELVAGVFVSFEVLAVIAVDAGVVEMVFVVQF